MADLGSDWRVVDGTVTAWFDAPSLAAGAALAERVLSLGGLADLRSTGVRVRLESLGPSAAVSTVARELGFAADPEALQQVGVVFESPDPAAITTFWQRVTGYSRVADHLADPWRRDPTMRFRSSKDQRPLRNRIHLDVVRPESSVEQADVGEAIGPYGVCHRDADGNEVDLVPGGPLGENDTTSDWQAVFSGLACYRVSSPEQQRDLVLAAAQYADEAGVPLLIDVRSGLVVLDSGKDRWEEDDRFATLAERIQTAARQLGAVADQTIPRFVQLFLDAADVDAVRAFWLAALGYVPDPREGVADIVDPRRLNPVLVFQELDASETERRRQRNRIQVELSVPAELAEHRVATALAAGGHVLDQSDNHWQITDPEGNELVITRAG